ncbi:MAG: flagellar biosynthesis protein [Alphaproteobacteria bacterium HGW-Alphaproteobacteria-1]|jgi:flagellar assembly protein FliH|nr:MAG: flagellar biosynthesis protein [Alphaproteobacteria bacterium HGW-Alphaproteobacteria-1]
MSVAHLLEEFGDASDGTPLAMTDVSLEEERLAAFEKGYQAGWDDAVKAQSEDARHITADLAQSLQDLRFTYEEAYGAVMAALRPLLTEMADAVLPHLARESLAPRIAEMLHDHARAQGRLPIEIAAAPEDLPRLEHLTGDSLEIALVADDTLAEGQVYLRFGESEAEVDLPGVLAGITAAVSGFFDAQPTGKAIA